MSYPGYRSQRTTPRDSEREIFVQDGIDGTENLTTGLDNYASRNTQNSRSASAVDVEVTMISENLKSALKDKYDKKLNKFFKRSTLSEIKFFTRGRAPSLLGTRKLGE